VANPRIEDLRKRIEKDPGSRLFAQLAEELRKDGELEDAIRVAREGLRSHPNYPSARMTLGRALLDTGDWAAARTEFELVLKSAPDNILASRYLAECLESLGERDAAIARYKSTLAMAPGEKHVVARLQELEGGAATPAASVAKGPSGASTRPAPAASSVSALRPASSTVPPVPASVSAAPFAAPRAASVPPVVSTPAAAAPPPAPPPAPLPPIPLSAVDGEMELETGRSGDGARASRAPVDEAPMAPIPLVDSDEEFELERPYDSPTVIAPARSAPSPPAPSSPAPPTVAAPATRAPTAPTETSEEEFELEAPRAAPSTSWAATIRPLPVMEEPPPPASPRPASPASPPPLAPPPPAPSAAPASAGGTASLISPTLGELYFNQGFTAKAIEVYRQLTVREPANERLGARLRELEKLQGALGGGGDVAPEASSDNPSADRRQAIERTIERLEGLLSAIRKG
jgi:tetratricopeptide (TPR) repeat protein